MTKGHQVVVEVETSDEDEGPFITGTSDTRDEDQVTGNNNDVVLGDLLGQGGPEALIKITFTKDLKNPRDGSIRQTHAIDDKRVLVIACRSLKDWNAIAKVARIRPIAVPRLSLVDRIQPLSRFRPDRSPALVVFGAILLSICGFLIFSEHISKFCQGKPVLQTLKCLILVLQSAIINDRAGIHLRACIFTDDLAL
jgi:hypothetical protein